ncbi:hypothetical protein [Aquimarina sp. 433]
MKKYILKSIHPLTIIASFTFVLFFLAISNNKTIGYLEFSVVQFDKIMSTKLLGNNISLGSWTNRIKELFIINDMRSIDNVYMLLGMSLLLILILVWISIFPTVEKF